MNLHTVDKSKFKPKISVEPLELHPTLTFNSATFVSKKLEPDRVKTTP